MTTPRAGTDPSAPAAPAADPPPGPLLQVSGLRTEFATPRGTVAAVRDVSFSLARRERMAIVGESGSGKSATAMSVVGLLQPPGRVVGGEVVFDGRDLRTQSEAEMSRVRGDRVSLVFQDPMSALDPIRSIGSQLVEGIRAHQDVSRRAARLLAADLLGEVGVAHTARRLSDYPHQYSGGMRQRVLIAMALANSPELVIADEPTTALDVTTQAQVLELLDRLVADRGAALILITHNLGIVAGYCDTVKVMYAGQLVEESASAELFRAPAHPYSRELIKCVVRTDRPPGERLATIPGALPDPMAPITGCSFEPRCPVGHGEADCLSREPVLVALGVADGAHASKCHFSGTTRQETRA